jgi:hypothetical protein
MGCQLRMDVVRIIPMEKPLNNRDALRIVLDTVGTKTALADKLGVAKQLVSRWPEIPPKYLAQTCQVTGLSPDWVLPELEASIATLLDRPAGMILPELIRLILNPEQKASPWAVRKRLSKSKASPSQPKRRRATRPSRT